MIPPLKLWKTNFWSLFWRPMGGLRRSRSALAQNLNRRQNVQEKMAQEAMRRRAGFPIPVTVSEYTSH